MASSAFSFQQALGLARIPLTKRLSPLSSIPQKRNLINRTFSLTTSRPYSVSVEAPDFLNDAERKIFDMIKDGLQPTKLEVQDISGGCGSMYAIDIESAQFQGLPVIKQHRLVNKVLGDEMKQWHGVRLNTKAA